MPVYGVTSGDGQGCNAGAPQAPPSGLHRPGWRFAFSPLESIVLGDGGVRHTDTLRALVEAGANVNLADRTGQTPLALARARGYGAMAAMLSIEADQLAAICEEAAQGEVVAPANFNSPGQIVIAGHASAVSRAIEIAKSKGFRKAMLLPVSAPFHCALMKPAADRLDEVLAAVAINTMVLPVITNVEATANQDAVRVRELLVAQVCAPVRWEQSVEAMISLGVSRFVEIGPGKVLTGLVKRINKEMVLTNIEDTAGVRAAA